MIRKLKSRRGVTQGGLAIPTLFNIFIETLGKDLEKHLWSPNSGLPAHLYADDVIIHGKSTLDLQRDRSKQIQATLHKFSHTIWLFLVGKNHNMHTGRICECSARQNAVKVVRYSLYSQCVPIRYKIQDLWHRGPGFGNTEVFCTRFALNMK